jgi:hypothetical protein
MKMNTFFGVYLQGFKKQVHKEGLATADTAPDIQTPYWRDLWASKAREQANWPVIRGFNA